MMKKIIVVICIVFIWSCTSERKKIHRDQGETIDVKQVYTFIETGKDSIAKEGSFREIIPYLESKLPLLKSSSEYSNRLKLDLAEYYLLDHLIDGNDTAFSHSTTLFEDVLHSDIQDSLLVKEFGISQNKADFIKTEWKKTNSQSEKEEFLIKVLIEKFDTIN